MPTGPSTRRSSNGWDYSFDPQTNVVDVLVYRLRTKLDAGFSVKRIPDHEGSVMFSARRNNRLRSFAMYLGMGYLIVCPLYRRDLFLITGSSVSARGFDREDVAAESESS